MKKLLKKVFVTLLTVALTFSMVNQVSTNHFSVNALENNDASQRSVNFNFGWKFYLGDNSSASNSEFNDSSWKQVSLPHDFSITQNFTTSGEAESGFLPGGTGWYRKAFVLDSSYENKSIVINFDGVYSDAYVYMNGQKIGEHHYGYTSFAFDISDYVTCDGISNNVIAVKVVNNIPSSRWYSGSGIYRDVNLIVSDRVHVGYNGTTVTTPNIAKGNGDVHTKVDVVNDNDSNETMSVKNTVYSSDDKAVSSTVTQTVSVNSKSTKTVDLTNNVSNPHLWSIDNPSLYYVRTEIIKDDKVIDVYDSTFGFRYYSFDNTGFHLNGKNVKLNGVCLHHDQGALGSAAYDDAMQRQLVKMKDMGVNAIRTSHNPVDEDFIEMCNELGLLVIEEAFDGWVDSKNGNSNDFSKYFNTKLSFDNHLIGADGSMSWAEFAIKSMVKRDRNNPSIILWSLCNEVQEGTNSAHIGNYASIAQNLINWIKEEDTTRPTTSGDNTRGNNSNLVSVLNTIRNNGGVVGFNYANTPNQLSDLANRFGGVIIASETSSATNSRGIYSSQANNTNVDGKLHLTSYDTSAVGWGCTANQSIWNTLTLDQVAGEFVWTGFDYIGEPTPWNGTGSGSVSGRGATPNSSYFGIVDTAGFEKDTYYLYRSQWNQKDTTLHLVTAWDSDNMMNASTKTPVVVYSNAAKVELYRDNTLIGTALRKTNTTAAGHVYYTYTVESNNNTICNAISGSEASSLYATFNVAYQAGTIHAKAFDESGKEITDVHGTSSVSTPDNSSQLKVTANKTKIDADGASLSYIEVEVLDKDGNLDTTATNTIQFSLTGNGEIVGVDNGDQATTDKFQQSSVLTSQTNAHIKAYAGKALIIVRSTTKAGSFDVNVTSNGLTGGHVSVTTQKVLDDTVTYQYKTDYSVKVGNMPALDTNIVKVLDEKEIKGTIKWDDSQLEDIIKESGDYSLDGIASFDDGSTYNVVARIHVIDDVVAMRNISTATSIENIPSLPTTVKGVKANGELSDNDFDVVWQDMTTQMFNTVGDIVTVQGEATVIDDEKMPVTATIRIAESINTESTNVAPIALSLTQDIEEGKQSDNLSSIKNGVTKPGDNTNERWTNWNNRTNSDTASLTFTWATSQMLSDVNLYYYYDNCSAKPENVKFEYSLNGKDFVEINMKEKEVETYNLGAKYSYTFEKVINPIALRITFTQQSGTTGAHCVGLTEAEIMTYKGAIEYNSEADLSMIKVHDKELDNFVKDTYQYNIDNDDVLAETNTNTAITILPVYENVIRILTISEDGNHNALYELTINGCQHLQTHIVNQKNPTCTEAGYTGDKICDQCLEVIEVGQTINALGHKYDNGVITQYPTTTTEGIKTYTCSVCGDKKTESIPVLTNDKVAPTVALSAQRADGTKIKLTGQFVDYANKDKYYEVTAHGLVYCTAAKLGTHVLTVNTAGRTRVNFGTYKDDGSFSYTMTPAYASTVYVVRSFVSYKDVKTGYTYYVYSQPIRVSYNTLTK